MNSHSRCLFLVLLQTFSLKYVVIRDKGWLNAAASRMVHVGLQFKMSFTDNKNALWIASLDHKGFAYFKPYFSKAISFSQFDEVETLKDM